MDSRKKDDSLATMLYSFFTGMGIVANYEGVDSKACKIIDLVRDELKRYVKPNSSTKISDAFYRALKRYRQEMDKEK